MQLNSVQRAMAHSSNVVFTFNGNNFNRYQVLKKSWETRE